MFSGGLHFRLFTSSHCDLGILFVGCLLIALALFLAEAPGLGTLAFGSVHSSLLDSNLFPQLLPSLSVLCSSALSASLPVARSTICSRCPVHSLLAKSMSATVCSDRYCDRVLVSGPLSVLNTYADAAPSAAIPLSGIFPRIAPGDLALCSPCAD